MKILVLCTGNRFRSPVLGWLLAQAEPGWEVQSAGTHCSMPGSEVSKRWRGCFEGWTTPHQARRVTDADVRWADVLLGVQRSHLTVHPAVDPGPRRIFFPVPDPAFARVVEWPRLAEELRERLPGLFRELHEYALTLPKKSV